MRNRKSVFILAGLLAVLIIYIIVTYNFLVQKEEKVKQHWSEVQNTYQRRLDLVPNLVTVVKGVSEFEQTTLRKIAELRTNAASIPGEITVENYNRQKQLQDSLATVANRLILIIENYPDLKGTKAYTGLQTQLEGTERRIKVARSDFNESVFTYNRKVKSFPVNIFAGLLGFKPKEGFTGVAGSEKTVEIKF